VRARGDLNTTQRARDTEEEYVTKVAEDVDEAIPLIEAGFELAAEYGEAKIFKKRTLARAEMELIFITTNWILFVLSENRS